MLEHQKRSKLFTFALKGQSLFGKVSGLVIMWSLWAVFFSEFNNIFIASIILSSICLGLGLIAPLIDFNESHATNPLWTGHSRFHLVWQVNALAVTGFFVLFFWAIDLSSPYDSSLLSDLLYIHLEIVEVLNILVMGGLQGGS